jgi:hypothetical protein
MANDLQLKPGTWLVSDCGKTPSDSNCQLVILAPEGQREDLVAAGTQHMVSKHGHADSPELQQAAADSIETVEIQ